MGFRPSEYFGAIEVDELEDGIDNSRIDGTRNFLAFHHILFYRFIWRLLWDPTSAKSSGKASKKALKGLNSLDICLSSKFKILKAKS